MRPGLAAGLAILVAALCAAPAGARVISVGANHNVAVFHSIDFVAAFGAAPATTTTVEVLRKGQRIGTATGPSVLLEEFPAPNDGGLEVNHGPEGAPVAGDCWQGFTPDIIPGDIVRVTRGAQVEQVEVDDITIDEGPFVNADGNVELRGAAALADGTPITLARLDSAEVRNSSDFRGAPTSVTRTPGTTDGWTMVYDVDVPLERERNGPHTAAERRALLLAGDHAMGFGHVAPLPLETQLFEGGEAPGPAPGCEAAPSESNAVASFDDAAYNVASGDLVVGGKVMAATLTNDVTSVVPRITDGSRTIKAAAINVAGAVRTWTATFRRADLDTLADGTLTAAADYVTSAGPIGGQELELPKDVVTPVVTPDQAPGEYTAPLSVALSTGAGETLTYRLDGLPSSANDRAYTGPIALAVGTTTISARSVDAAGNITDRQFTYTVNAPPPAPAATAAPVAVVAPVALAPAASSRPALAAAALRATRRMRLRTLRRAGLRFSFASPAGARVAVVRLFRGRTLVATRTLALAAAGRHAVRFRPRRAGLYRAVIRVGAARDALGPARTATTRIVR